jgi:hypothetical protein
METKFSKRSAGSVVATAIAMTLVAGSANADHAWSNYHWARSSNPFSLGLGDNLSSVWDPYLQTTSSDWSVSNVLDTTVVAGQSSQRRCRASTGRVEVCNGSYGNNGWLGIASISVSGSHITSGSVRVNDTYFNTAQYNTTAWRNLVMCQEVGHIFGLDHQDENFSNQNLGTCMDYTNSPASNQHPNAHDYEELSIIYSHLDGSAAATLSQARADAPPAMEQLDLAGPGQWGRVIGRYADGRPRVYELDFGRGYKIITHVFWVPESRGRR